MKLIKCKKCGATVMTAETLLSAMQDEYNELVAEAKRAKPANKNIYLQQMSHLTKMMTAVCHNSSEAEIRKSGIGNFARLLKSYVFENGLVSQELIDEMHVRANAEAKRKAEEDEKKLAALYGDFDSMLVNRTKRDNTARTAIRNINNEKKE